MANVAQFWAEQFVDDSNNPFAGVKVYHYEAGTTSIKDVYRDRAKTTIAENPVEGDSLGVVWFYGDGLYRLRVTTSDDILLYDWDNVEIAANAIQMDTSACEAGMVPVYVGPSDEFECDFLDLENVQGCLPIANCGTGTDDTPEEGSLLIGNSSEGYTVGQLTSDDGSIDINVGNGTIDISVAQAQAYGSIGLYGIAAATTVTLNADVVGVRNPTEGSSFVINAPQAVAATTSAAGANGKDQDADFDPGTWIHAYWIYRPADEDADPPVEENLEAILSLSPPPVGPNLTSGPMDDSEYTHWAYAGAFRLDDSSAFVDSRVCGNIVFYNLRQEALNDGLASVETSVDLSNLIPPNALAAQLMALYFQANHSAFDEPQAMISPFPGMVRESSFAFLTSGEDPEGDTQSFTIPNVSQRIYYINDSSGGTQKSLHIYVQSYTVPNNGG